MKTGRTYCLPCSWQMIVRFALFDRLFLPFVAETGPKFWDSSDTWARQCCFGCCKDITETCQHVGGIKWEKGRNYSWRVIHAGLSKRAGGCYEVYYQLLSLNYTVLSIFGVSIVLYFILYLYLAFKQLQRNSNNKLIKSDL